MHYFSKRPSEQGYQADADPTDVRLSDDSAWYRGMVPTNVSVLCSQGNFLLFFQDQ